MTNALPTSTDASLLKHFELQRSPFERLSDPSELYLTEQHSFLSAHLADAMEEQDMLVVVCGQPGSGKSSLLARYCSTVYENICLASIDDRCVDIANFYSTMLGQFGFGDISGTVDQLKHICVEFLKQQGKAGDPVVLLVDNAHKLRPEIFEQLRWVAAIRHKGNQIVNLVLAGHPDLAKIMESPAMSQISAKRHVRFNIRAYTEDETANYIWHRLELAGDRQCVQFSDEAHGLIFRYSGGTPGLINRICNEAMQEVYKNKKKTISGEVVRRVAENQNLIPHVVPVHNKSRRKTDADYVDETMRSKAEVNGNQAPDTEEVAEKPTAEKPAHRKSDAEAVAASDSNTKPRAAEKKRSAASALSIVEKVASLSEQLGDLRARKKDLELELFQRDSTIASLEDRLESEKQLHLEAKGRLESDDSGRDALQSKLNKSRSKLKSQIEKISALSDESAALKEKLETALKTSETRQQSLNSAEARIEVLQERAELSASLQSALKDREQRVKDLESTLREQEAAVRDSRARADEQAREISDLLAQAKEGAKAAEELADLRKVAEEQTSEISDLRAQANKGANAAEELADLRKVADEQACEITALRAQTKEAEGAADELAGLRKIADEQELEIQSLREIVEADTGKDDANQLKIRIRDLEQDLGEADGRYQELEAEKSAALEQAEQMASQVSALNDELKASEDRQESTRRESLALKEKLAVSEQVVRDMQDALRGRDEHADWLKTELNRLRGADEALAQSKNEKTEAEKQHRILEEELHSAREELSQLRADLDKAASAHKELAEARQELEATRNRVSETDALAATLAEEKAVLTNTLSDREAALAHLDEQNRDIANQKESLEEMLEDITARLAERELALDNTRKAEQQLATENKDLISDLDALRDEMKQASAFKTQYEKQKELNAKLGATLDEQTEEIAELTTKLAEQAIAHSKANASLSGMNKLKPEIGELSSQIDDMHSQMLANHENTNEIEQQIEANDLKFTEAQEEIAALRALHVELRGELRTAEVQTGELDKAKQEILSLQDIVAELRNSQTESERSGDELSELQLQLADRDQQQQELAQELSESRAQLNEIQKEFAREAEDNHELQRQLLALAEVEEQLREELLQRGDSYEDLAAIENERNQLREELESLRRIHDSVRQKQKAEAASRQTRIPEGRFAFDLQFRHGKSKFDTRRLVEEGDRLLIGRGQQSDVVVDSEFVSRNHLLISISRGRLFVKDLHSTNGTFVNGKRVSHYEMRDGDVIGIGEHSISLAAVPL